MIDVATETLLTVTKAARRLGKHPDTVRAWIRAGRLEGVFVAGRLHTSLEAIERASAPALPAEKPKPQEGQTARQRKCLETLREFGMTD
jgi:excisionase family DNA binding protein